MSEAQEALETAIETFLHADDYLPEQFKKQLTTWAHLERNVLLKEGLEVAIRDKTVSPESLEGMTNTLVDTQEEVDGFLAALWAYIYEDGPEPDAE